MGDLMSIVELNDLKKYYDEGTTKALDGINLKIEEV